MAQIAIVNDKSRLDHLGASQKSPQLRREFVRRRLLHNHTEVVHGVGMHVIRLEKMFHRKFLCIGLKAKFGGNFFLHIYRQ